MTTAEIPQHSVSPHVSAAHTARTAHANPPVEPEGQPRRSWSVLCVALAAQVLVVLDISVVNTALPTIGRELDLNSHDLQWLVTAYLLMSGGGLLLGGRIADLLPRRLVFLVGLALFTTASLVAGLAGSAGVLLAARATQGLGAAAMTPAALSLIMTFYSGSQRTKGLALWGAVGSMGVAAGVLLGGALTTWAGWQAIFWINVPVGIAAFASAVVLLPKQGVERANLSRLDLPGGLTAIAALGALLLGIQGTSEHGWTSVYSVGLFAAAAALLTAFVAIERRVASPLVPPHTWKVKTLVSGTSVMLGATGILVGVIFLTSIFAQTVLGYSALQAGLVFLPLALVMAAAAHAAGRLMGKVSPRAIAVAGLSLSIGGALLLAGAPAGGRFTTDLLPGLLTLGFGIGLVFVSVSVTAMVGIPAQHSGLASGFLMTGHELGAALGVAVISAVAATAGSLTSTSGAADAFSRGMVATAVIALVMAAIAFVTLPAKPQAAGAGMHMHH